MYRRIMLGLMVNTLLILWGCYSVSAAGLDVAVVPGNFVYSQSNPSSSQAAANEVVHYRVQQDCFHGKKGWLITMSSAGTRMELFIRQDNGMTSYLKRVDYLTKQVVEIIYGVNGSHESLYIRQTPTESYQRLIKVDGLLDLSSLPSVILGMAKEGRLQDLHFKSIDYSTGEVMEMVATLVGFRNVDVGGTEIRCAVYDVKVNSWLAIFTGHARLLIPMVSGLANFLIYDGPSFEKHSGHISLRLIDVETKMASK